MGNRTQVRRKWTEYQGWEYLGGEWAGEVGKKQVVGWSQPKLRMTKNDIRKPDTLETNSKTIYL